MKIRRKRKNPFGLTLLLGLAAIGGAGLLFFGSKSSKKKKTYTPAQVCRHLAKLGLDEESNECLDVMMRFAEKDPKAFQQFASCFEKAGTEEKALACVEQYRSMFDEIEKELMEELQPEDVDDGSVSMHNTLSTSIHEQLGLLRKSGMVVSVIGSPEYYQHGDIYWAVQWVEDKTANMPPGQIAYAVVIAVANGDDLYTSVMMLVGRSDRSDRGSLNLQVTNRVEEITMNNWSTSLD